jgi:O-antigen/teichoic acid export membrane protein
MNFVYQIFMVRSLPVVDYGVLNSLLSAFMIISIPIASGTTMVAKFTSGYVATGERGTADVFIRRVFKHVFFGSIMFIMVYFIYGLHMKDFLRLDSATPIYLVGGLLFFANLSTVSLGGLQGLESFVWYSATNMTGAFLKLGLAVLFIGLGWGVTGAIAAILVSQFAAFVVNIIPLRRNLMSKVKTAASNLRLKEKYKYIIPVFVSYAAFAVFTNVDIVLVKHFFQPAEAGAYSVAQIIGKITLFLPIAIATVLLPRASGLHAQNKGHRAVLEKSMVFTGLLCGLVILVYNLFPGFILVVFTGKATGEIILLGRLFSVAMAFFSLIYVLVSYQLSVNRFRFIKWLAVFSVLYILAILVFHRSLYWILYIMLASGATLLFINLKLAVSGEVNR